MDILYVVEGLLAFVVALLAWFAANLYSRLIMALDLTIEKLGHVGETQAAHSARLDALERGK